MYKDSERWCWYDDDNADRNVDESENKGCNGHDDDRDINGIIFDYTT